MKSSLAALLASLMFVAGPAVSAQARPKPSLSSSAQNKVLAKEFVGVENPCLLVAGQIGVESGPPTTGPYSKKVLSDLNAFATKMSRACARSSKVITAEATPGSSVSTDFRRVAKDDEVLALTFEPPDWSSASWWRLLGGRTTNMSEAVDIVAVKLDLGLNNAGGLKECPTGSPAVLKGAFGDC